METRKITIVETKNQKKSVIMSSATTLRELKQDLREANIDYDGMTFFEGVSHVELQMDDAVLPHDVPYKGTTTNELVFMLTNTNKKIKSGAVNRAELYNTIKSLGLQSLCMETFGKSFTQCSNDTLIKFIEDCNSKISIPTNTECVDHTARKAIEALVNVLINYDLINEEDAKDVLSILNGNEFVETTNTNASPYSNAEIDSMFECFN
jgi:hypothetical protein